MKVLRVTVADGFNLTPEETAVDHGRLIVGCGDGGAIEILQLKPEGKRAMPAADFLRGLHL